ncbi:DUF2927 domain-containing protein [Oharaeibacter diazotrophicus]|uniref:DUF2927 family protein n=1 Tax=Oharaeibacter diazotrophicus TaxID=1920512 RepID=A0A4R6RAA7_9HYPH|nr:DUF2927 domain-containing protein [Oharaeibacter diazotrophicus]TDP82576.1 DUF2927 family protein [Oharaeibacter diazotrophicus]BBE72660.1 hypothetical protein OHA_1_02258 [Pleomorphomonas sp. SM30]GLS76694.1 hypothetical protein GCM10007904_20310 [Oharaeibacter diazotrophicus]
MAFSSRDLVRRLRVGLTALAVAVVALAPLAPATAEAGQRRSGAYSDAQLIDGFRRTVFGVEYGSSRYGAIVKKYAGPVSFRIVNKASIDRTKAITSFVRSLPGLVRGLETRVVGEGARADFTVVVVDREAYVETVRADVLGSHAGAAPGSCIAKVDVGRSGITSSVAVVVSDEGEAMFRRCMTEEILQGLGPMNDDSSLMASVFNDRTTHAKFMPFDRAILSMLYDPRIRHGMSKSEATAILPEVLADVRRRIR